MIEARFSYGEADGSLHMKLEGHAGSAPGGQNLVCAAVSALAYTLAAAVLRLHTAAVLRNAPSCQLEEGLGEVAAVPQESFREAVQMAFWTVQCGMAALAEHFPEQVTLCEVMQVKEVEQ